MQGPGGAKATAAAGSGNGGKKSGGVRLGVRGLGVGLVVGLVGFVVL